eukprot:75516_1
MSSFPNLFVLIAFTITTSIAIKVPWRSPQLPGTCVYNQPPKCKLIAVDSGTTITLYIAKCGFNHPNASIELQTDLFGGTSGSTLWATWQGRIHSISWGISKKIPEYNIDNDAVANLQFQSDMQSENVTFGTDPVDFCVPFTVEEGDHISGFRVIYRDVVHGLYFHTKNGLTYKCVANISHTYLYDSGDIYMNNSYLSGFQVRMGGVIDAIGFIFTICTYPTYAPTHDPTFEPTITTENPTPLITTENPTIEPTTLIENPTPLITTVIPTSLKPTDNVIITRLSSTSQILNEGNMGHKRQNSIIDLETLLWITLVCLLMCFLFLLIIVIRRCYYQKKSVYVVDKALVLIIGISKFENTDKYHNLPGVEKNVKELISLWQDTFQYEVFTCLDATYDGIINFVDDHTKTLMDDSSRSYKAVFVHILSHGLSEKEAFITFDSKNIETAIIKNKIQNAANTDLVKIIFYDACRGEANYCDPNRVIHDDQCWICCCICCHHSRYMDENNDDDNRARGISTMSKNVGKNETNLDCVTIYGTIEDRSLADKGWFTKCICDVFERNINKHHLKQNDFNSLIVEIGSILLKKSNNAQICSSKGMVTLKQKIIFRKCPRIDDEL